MNPGGGFSISAPIPAVLASAGTVLTVTDRGIIFESVVPDVYAAQAAVQQFANRVMTTP